MTRPIKYLDLLKRVPKASDEVQKADHLKGELDEVGELTLSGGQIEGVL